MIFVDDLGDAFVALLDSDITGAVNVGTGNGQRLGQISRLIAEELERPDLLTILGGSDEPRSLVANTQRLNEEVGYRAKTSLKDGIKQTIEWITANQ